MIEGEGRLKKSILHQGNGYKDNLHALLLEESSSCDKQNQK